MYVKYVPFRKEKIHIYRQLHIKAYFGETFSVTFFAISETDRVLEVNHRRVNLRMMNEKMNEEGFSNEQLELFPSQNQTNPVRIAMVYKVSTQGLSRHFLSIFRNVRSS